MIDVKLFSQVALSFPEALESPHFEKRSFRVRKKIFATLSLKDKTAVLKLSPEDQSVFCAFDKSVMYPVAGTWGIQGWTVASLKTIRKEMLLDALTRAWCTVAPKKLVTDFLKDHPAVGEF